ncbi:MAG: nitroreductase family protein [Halioglobus sp.]|nr:nitroreductase family protein [Halioglobus sp.]
MCRRRQCQHRSQTLQFCTDEEDRMGSIGLDIDEVLSTTRNVRKRLDLERPVEREVVEECLDLALQAPNGSNQQTWEWMLIDDPDKRKLIADINRDALAHFLEVIEKKPDILSSRDIGRNERMDQIGGSVLYLIEVMERVPVLVIPMHRGKMEGKNVFYQASMWGSIIPAAWSFMLALRSRGLGSALTTLHLWKEQEVAEALGIPFKEYTQAGLFPVAYTKGLDFKSAQRRPAADVMHWNKW